MFKGIQAIILAAGKGERLGLKDVNKVTVPLDNMPILTRTINNLKETGIKNIMVVVGHKKESVLKLLDSTIAHVDQKKQLGTAHAVETALKKTPSSFTLFLILNGDDSYLLNKEILLKLISLHQKNKNKVSFITTFLDNPLGIGRIIRDGLGRIQAVVEEKDATAGQKKIREINIGCYLIERSFLEKFLPMIKKNPITKERYIVDIVKLGIKSGYKIQDIVIKNLNWRGINTKDELRQAQRRFI